MSKQHCLVNFFSLTDHRLFGSRWANRCVALAEIQKCELWWRLLLRWSHHRSAHQRLTRKKWYVKTFSIPFCVQKVLLSCLNTLTIPVNSDLLSRYGGSEEISRIQNRTTWPRPREVFVYLSFLCCKHRQQYLSYFVGFQFDGDDTDQRTLIFSNLVILSHLAFCLHGDGVPGDWLASWPPTGLLSHRSSTLTFWDNLLTNIIWCNLCVFYKINTN